MTRTGANDTRSSRQNAGRRHVGDHLNRALHAPSTGSLRLREAASFGPDACVYATVSAISVIIAVAGLPHVAANRARSLRPTGSGGRLGRHFPEVDALVRAL